MSFLAEVISERSIPAEGVGLADYSAALRALIRVDKPARPTPYDDLTLTKFYLGIAHNTTRVNTWTATDWGAGMDFYVTNIHFAALTPGWLPALYGELWKEWDNSYLMVLENGVTAEKLFIKTYTALDPNVVGEPDDVLPNAWYRFQTTFSFARMKHVGATESLKMSVSNWTGFWMYNYVYVSGIPVPP